VNRESIEPAQATDECPDHLALGGRHGLGVVRQLTEHPAGQHLLQRAVEHPGGEPRVDVGPERALVLAAHDDALQAREGLSDLVELVLDVRAARDLADEQPHQVRVVAPGTEDDLHNERELLRRAVTGLFGERHCCEQAAPLLTEDRLEHRFLRAEVVVDEPVGDTCLLRDVTDARGLVALGGEDTDGRGEDQLSLVLGCRHEAKPYSAVPDAAPDIHTVFNPTNTAKGWHEHRAGDRCNDLSADRASLKRSELNPATDNPVPESADPRPRLGDLLLGAGLITPEQLDESLAAAHTAGKPLGHVLVEQGLVPAHSIAMALADQHGGPLKTEFGFATGRGSTPRKPDLLSEAPSAPPVLRLAPAQPVAEVAPPTVAVTPAATPTPVATPPPATPPAATVAPEPEPEAETAVRLGADARVNELVARTEELQAELETTQAAAAALRTQFAAEREAREQDAKTVEAWRAQLEAARAQTEQAARTEEELRAQLEELRARDDAPPALAAAEELIAAVRGELQTALAAAEELRVQLAAERAATEHAATATDSLSAQIEELRSRQAADAHAASAAEDALVKARAELASALAEANDLRKTIADDRAERERAVETAETLRAELAELRADSSAEETLAAVRAELARALADAETARATAETLRAELDELRADNSAEETLAAVRAELARALADAETARATLAGEREGHQEVAAALNALRGRVTELEAEVEAAALEAAAREAQPPAVVSLDEDVDQLRAVIELQEQALAAAAARERARDGDARVIVELSTTNAYSNDLHFLFAPSTDGYELLERSGPSPSPGEVVELSGGRTCRVLRVGPTPFPGPEACAYLELV
jgi:hypothetical protein